jgi:fused signal recognition particle receptor
MSAATQLKPNLSNFNSSNAAQRLFWQQAMSLTLPQTEVISSRADLYRRFFAPGPVVEHVPAALTINPELVKLESVNPELPHPELIVPASNEAVSIESQKTPSREYQVALESVSLVQRLKRGLSKTRQQFSLAQLFTSKPQNAEALFAALETQLMMADVGVAATDKLLTAVRQQLTHLNKQALQSIFEQVAGQGVKNLLRQAMLDILDRPQANPFAMRPLPKPFVLLMVGVNGVGKTTTLGKLAKQLIDQGQQVLLAAGDTFRAAAIEQLQAWGERNQVPVVAQQAGADAAAVLYDAVSRAKARQIDVVLADTAGRLHNKTHLMDELSKLVRVIKKQDTSAPHSILLVVDATTGQNAITQAKVFQQLIGVTGIVLTKLDGTAKGGIAFALVEQLQLPICYVGVGEQVEDLKPFVASDFVDALLDMEAGYGS